MREMEQKADEKRPAVSVVIPTMGRRILRMTLESLAAAEGFDGVEVWVAGHIPDAKMTEWLKAFCVAHRQVRHLDVSFSTGDSSRKKNAGAAAARSDLIAFLDDDVVVAPDWPRRITEAFADEQVGLACGPSLIPDELNFSARLAGLALSSPAAGYVAERYRQNRIEAYAVDWDRIIGCNAIYRRRAFEAMGGFPAEYYPGEEMIAAYRTERAGWRLMFLPRAWVKHYPRSSLSRFWRQVWGYGATRIRLIRGGVSFHPLPLIPGLWVGVTLGLALGAFFSRWVLGLLALDLALYALLDAAITLRMVLETRRASDWALALMIPFMHLSYGLAEWAEFFRPGRDFGEIHAP